MTVYFIASDCGRVKIGYTADASAKGRLGTLQVGSPRKLSIIAEVEGEQSFESRLHAVCRTERLHGEWFQRGPLVSSLIDYVTEFGAVDGWFLAEKDPTAWAEHLRRQGHPERFAEIGHEGLPRVRREWQEQRHARKLDLRCIGYAWRMAGSVDLTSRVVHRIEQFYGDRPFVWTYRGRECVGAGLAHTFDALQANARTGEDLAIAVLVSACIHDIVRGSKHVLLEQRCHDALLVMADLARAAQVGWHHLSMALPEAMFLPDCCSLSLDEFVGMCCRHVRLLWGESRIELTHREGAICGLQPFRSTRAA